MLALPQPLF